MADSDKKRSPFGIVSDFIRRLLAKKPPPESGDPYAYRMAPVSRSPRGRSGAAVAEIEDDSDRSFPPRRF